MEDLGYLNLSPPQKKIELELLREDFVSGTGVKTSAVSPEYTVSYILLFQLSFQSRLVS